MGPAIAQQSMTRSIQIAALAALTAFVAACATPDEAKEIRVEFTCTTGEQLVLRFLPGVAHLVRGGRSRASATSPTRRSSARSCCWSSCASSA
jgi:hypothetical protein